MPSDEEQFEAELLKIADFPLEEEQKFRGDEINKWARVALEALAEFLQPKEGIMVKSGDQRWFVWRIGQRNFRLLNPEAEANAALKDMEVSTLVRVTRVSSDGGIPTKWEVIPDG